MIGRICVGIWRGLDGLRKFLHLLLLLLDLRVRRRSPADLDPAHRGQLRAGHRAARAISSSSSPAVPSTRRIDARAGRRAGRNAALGSHRRARGREEGRAHQGGRARSQLHGRRRPADARGVRSGHRRFPLLRQEGRRARRRDAAGAVLRRRACRRDLHRSARPRRHRRLRALSHVLQGPLRQARRDRQPVPRRRLQERGRGLRAHGHVARGSRGKPRVPQRAVVELPARRSPTARGLKPEDISAYVENAVPAHARREGRRGQGRARREARHRPQVLARRRAPHGRAGRQRRSG